MLYVIWGILVLPVIIVGMILHFKIKEWGKRRWNILPKCLSTWMIVCTGFLGIWARGDSQGLDRKWILAALVLFLLAARHRHGSQAPEYIRELKADKLHILRFHQLHNIFLGVVVHIISPICRRSGLCFS